MQKKNKGFTLVEMVITVSIFAILLGILVPSLNSIIGFRVQRATNSIASGLDKTKIEASNRLVGEMKLEKRSNGYYISYILDRGKVNGNENIKWNEDEEKIAPAKTLISYKVENNDDEIPLEEERVLLLPIIERPEDFYLYRIRMKPIGMIWMFLEFWKRDLQVVIIVVRLLSVEAEEKE